MGKRDASTLPQRLLIVTMMSEFGPREGRETPCLSHCSHQLLANSDKRVRIEKHITITSVIAEVIACVLARVLACALVLRSHQVCDRLHQAHVF